MMQPCGTWHNNKLPDILRKGLGGGDLDSFAKLGTDRAAQPQQLIATYFDVDRGPRTPLRVAGA